jgi:hypothetical protein
MPIYSFSIDDGAAISGPDSSEDLATNQAAIERAKQVAHDFRISLTATPFSRVVVRNVGGDKVGEIPVLGTRG